MMGTPTVINPLRLSRVETRKRWTPANTAPPSSPSSQLFQFSGMRIETSFLPMPLGSRSAASQSARMFRFSMRKTISNTQQQYTR